MLAVAFTSRADAPEWCRGEALEEALACVEWDERCGPDGGQRGEFIGTLVAFKRADGAVRVEVAQHCSDPDTLVELIPWAAGVD